MLNFQRRKLTEWADHDLETNLTLLAICFLLVLLSGLFSGLTLGLMSLDTLDMEVLLRSGTAREQKQAKKILPLIKNGHMLLVSLLMCNAGAMEALPIFLDSLASPVMAVLLSVTAVLFFGEIIPQSICGKFGLAVGAHCAPFVRLIMFICSPVAWPLGKIIDLLLGSEHHVLYRRRQLKELVQVHGEQEGLGGKLTKEETDIITGALDLTNKVALRSMTPLHKVFMISTDDRLDSTTLKRILASGHSRVPVHRAEDRRDVVGIILVKELLQYCLSSQEVPVNMIRLRSIPRLSAAIPMYDLLKLFQTGRTHIAMLTQPTDAELERVGLLNPQGGTTTPPLSPMPLLNDHSIPVLPGSYGRLNNTPYGAPPNNSQLSISSLGRVPSDMLDGNGESLLTFRPAASPNTSNVPSAAVSLVPSASDMQSMAALASARENDRSVKRTAEESRRGGQVRLNVGGDIFETGSKSGSTTNLSTLATVAGQSAVFSPPPFSSAAATAGASSSVTPASAGAGGRVLGGGGVVGGGNVVEALADRQQAANPGAQEAERETITPSTSSSLGGRDDKFPSSATSCTAATDAEATDGVGMPAGADGPRHVAPPLPDRTRPSPTTAALISYGLSGLGPAHGSSSIGKCAMGSFGSLGSSIEGGTGTSSFLAGARDFSSTSTWAPGGVSSTSPPSMLLGDSAADDEENPGARRNGGVLSSAEKTSTVASSSSSSFLAGVVSSSPSSTATNIVVAPPSPTPKGTKAMPPGSKGVVGSRRLGSSGGSVFDQPNDNTVAREGAVLGGASSSPSAGARLGSFASIGSDTGGAASVSAASVEGEAIFLSASGAASDRMSQGGGGVSDRMSPSSTIAVDGPSNRRPRPGEPIGLITLEDVIEELIRTEIVDETDRYIDNEKRVRVNNALKSIQGATGGEVLRLLLPSGLQNAGAKDALSSGKAGAALAWGLNRAMSRGLASGDFSSAVGGGSMSSQSSFAALSGLSGARPSFPSSSGKANQQLLQRNASDAGSASAPSDYDLLKAPMLVGYNEYGFL